MVRIKVGSRVKVRAAVRPGHDSNAFAGKVLEVGANFYIVEQDGMPRSRTKVPQIDCEFVPN